MDTALNFDVNGSVVKSSSVTLRQGNHLVDNITIKCENGSTYDSVRLEFELPKERKHSTLSLAQDGENYMYSVPSCITRYSGVGEMQLVATKGDKIMRSDVIPINIEPSVKAETSLNEKDKNDFFVKMFDAIGRADGAADIVLRLESELKSKVENGEFNGTDGADGERGEKGEKGETGNTPYIGSNGHWFVGNTDLGIEARGEKGDRGSDAVMSEVNGFYHLYINENGHLIVKYPSDNAVNNFSINDDGHLIFTV